MPVPLRLWRFAGALSLARGRGSKAGCFSRVAPGAKINAGFFRARSVQAWSAFFSGGAAGAGRSFEARNSGHWHVDLHHGPHACLGGRGERPRFEGHWHWHWQGAKRRYNRTASRSGRARVKSGPLRITPRLAGPPTGSGLRHWAVPTGASESESDESSDSGSVPTGRTRSHLHRGVARAAIRAF